MPITYNDGSFRCSEAGSVLRSIYLVSRVSHPYTALPHRAERKLSLRTPPILVEVTTRTGLDDRVAIIPSFHRTLVVHNTPSQKR
jgi:hypothetical protein